jgi:flagellar basal body-associated protein FliL
MTPRPTRRGGIVLILGAIALVAAACAGAGASFAPLAGGGAPAAAPAGEQPAATAAAYDEAGTRARDGDAPLRDEALVVKTGSLQLETKELGPTLLRARSIIVGLGGYISASEQASSETREVASVTYRIPADRWEDALDGLKRLGTKLVSEQTGAVEVTGQVIDLGARIENLRAAEVELRSYIAQATKISDILEIQAQLTSVRGEIEQLTAQKEHLQDQASFGTLAVTWEVPVAPVAEARTGWDPQAEIDRALAQLVQLGQAVATVGIWLLIVALPVLLAVGIVVGGLALVARRFAPRPEVSAPVPPAA